MCNLWFEEHICSDHAFISLLQVKHTQSETFFGCPAPPPFFLGFIALAVLEWKSDRKRMDVSRAVNGSLVEKQDDEDATPKILGSPRRIFGRDDRIF